MANIGSAEERGVCANKPINKTYMNTAVISVRRKLELMITRIVDLVVAHGLFFFYFINLNSKKNTIFFLNF